MPDSRSADHNRVIKAAAREALAPLGLTQVERSRTWLDDRIWHLIVVEFQPSGFSKGSYLNVGATWLWHPKDHLSFDHEYRARGFEPADEGDWPCRARDLASAAVDRVTALRRAIRDLHAAGEILRAGGEDGHGWPRFSAGIALGLLGEREAAARALADVAGASSDLDWVRGMAARAAHLRRVLDDPDAFRSAIVEDIIRARGLLDLVERSPAEIAAALEASA